MTNRTALELRAIGAGLERYHWVAALLLVGLGLALRLGSFDEYWVNADEGIYLNAASGDWARLQDLILTNAHPPLFYLILFGMSVLSDDYVWLRIPSLLCGCLAILAVHLLARRIAGWPAGLFAAGMLAISPAGIMLSQVIRPYSMLLASLSFAIWLLLCELTEPQRRQRIGYVLLICSSLLLHYSAIILLPGIAACILLARVSGQIDGARFRQLSLLQLPAALITAGLILLHIVPELMGSELQALARDDGWLEGFYPASFDAVWEDLLGILAYCFGSELIGSALLLFLIGLLMPLAQARSAVLGLLLGSLLAAIGLAAFGLYPFGPTRHAIYLMPLLLLSMSLVIGRAYALGLRRAWPLDLCILLILLFPGISNSLLGAQEVEVSMRQEQRLRPETIAAALRILDSQAESEGVILMDQRCFNTLAPILGEAADASFAGLSSRGYQSFAWQGWTVVVSESWVITASHANSEREDHLLKLLEKVAAGSPEIPLADQQRVLILADGRIPRVVQDFLSLLPESESGGALILASHNLTSFHVFAIDMRRYLELMN